VSETLVCTTARLLNAQVEHHLESMRPSSRSLGLEITIVQSRVKLSLKEHIAHRSFRHKIVLAASPGLLTQIRQ
jgi:hypothetical protein